MEAFVSEENHQWGGLVGWPLIPIHMAVIPNSKVLSFRTEQNGMQCASCACVQIEPTDMRGASK